MKRRALVISSYPAPYRVAVFSELSKEYQLDIFFDTCKNENRDPKWFRTSSEKLHFDVLNTKEAKNRFKQALRNINCYDFLLAYDPAREPSILAVHYARKKHIPYFVNNDGAFVRKGNPIKTLVKRMMFRHAALSFASGKSSSDYFKAFGVPEEKIRYHSFTSLVEEDILSAPVPPEKKAAIREELGFRENDVYVLTVGQFIYRKGFDLLLSAWTKINDHANAQLLIIGGGDKRAEYDQFIKENSLENVTIIDFLEKGELFQYYKASDIFVLPTREDIWGLVINEAMACGLPVISSDMCIAARELVVHGENGFLYPVNDVHKLTEYLNDMIFDPSLRHRFAQNNIKAIQGNTMVNIARRHFKDIEAYFSTANE